MEIEMGRGCGEEGSVVERVVGLGVEAEVAVEYETEIMVEIEIGSDSGVRADID